MAADHRDLHYVRGGSLDHGVDGKPLPLRAGLVLRRPQLRNRTYAAEESLDVTVFGRFGDGLFDERLHGGKAAEIPVDVLGSLIVRNVELLRQPVRTEAVDDAEVDSLRLRTLTRADFPRGKLQHLRRSCRMDIL